MTKSSGPPWMWREAAKQVVRAGFEGGEGRWSREDPGQTLSTLRSGVTGFPRSQQGSFRGLVVLFSFCFVYFVFFAAPSQFSSKSHCHILCARVRLAWPLAHIKTTWLFKILVMGHRGGVGQRRGMSRTWGRRRQDGKP